MPVTRNSKQPKSGQRGFTLIELLVVVAIIGIIAGIAAARYSNATPKAREAVLKTNLNTLRDVIDQYYADKAHYPNSLEDLVDEGYLRTIPTDPMTGSTDTWDLIYNTPNDLNPDEQSGIFDVKSGATGVGLDGSPYSEW
jgi:general secretion pathway protein G